MAVITFPTFLASVAVVADRYPRASPLSLTEFLDEVGTLRLRPAPRNLLARADPIVDDFKALMVRAADSPEVRPVLEALILPPLAGWSNQIVGYEMVRKALLALEEYTQRHLDRLGQIALAASAPPPEQPLNHAAWPLIFCGNDVRHWFVRSQGLASDPTPLTSQRVWEKVDHLKGPGSRERAKSLLRAGPISDLLDVTEAWYLYSWWIPDMAKCSGELIDGRPAEAIDDFLERTTLEACRDFYTRELASLRFLIAANPEELLRRPAEEILALAQDVVRHIRSRHTCWHYFIQQYFHVPEAAIVVEGDFDTLANIRFQFDPNDPSKNQGTLEQLDTLEALQPRYSDLQRFVERSGILTFRTLLQLWERLTARLMELATSDPACPRSLVTGYQHSNDYVVDEIIDRALGFKTPSLELYLEADQPWEEVWARYGAHTQFQYSGIGYGVVRILVRHLSLTEDDTVYELGSGFGRLALYLGLTTCARVRGIELFPPRHETACRLRDQLGLERVQFICDDASTCNFSDGTVFVIFNSFEPETLRTVTQRLKAIAQARTGQGRRIRIVSHGPSSYYLSSQGDWLKPLMAISNQQEVTPQEALLVFESV